MPAVFADAIDLEGVSGRKIVVFPPDFLLQAINLRGEKFDRSAALGANHVMVAAAVILMLVAGDAVMKSHFACEPALGQNLESAIDRGKAYPGISFLHQAVKLVG